MLLLTEAYGSKSLRSPGDPRRVRIESLLHFLDICNHVVALSPSCRANVAAVDVRPVLDHELVYTAAHERVHAQLKALSHAYLFRQKTIAILPGAVLGVRAVTMPGMRVAYRCRDLVYRLAAGLLSRAAQAQDESLEEVSEPLEHNIILCYLTSRVPRHPCVDHNWKRDIVERRKGKVDARSG